MGSARRTRPQEPDEFQPEQAAGAGKRRAKAIEWDPDQHSGPGQAGGATIEVQSSADTFVPHADFFAARDELEKQMGGHSARISAFAASNFNTAGRENVVGFGVGFKYSCSTLTGDIAAKVYVREKLPMAQISATSKVPATIAGIETDVESIGDVLLHTYVKQYPTPVPCGVSISNITLGGSGTLGCLVVLSNNKLCLLSNNHVLANSNSAAIGSSIVQPGNAEPAATPTVIGQLENFVVINATGNLVDAAVAWTSASLVSAADVTYSVNPAPLAPALGLTVMKNGRTTQSTMGVVTDIGVNIYVGYEPFPAGAEMRNQVAIRGIGGPFSMPGDSGSLIVTAGSKQPVALLFAGSNDNSMTFANPIAAVMAALNIDRFVGG